MCFYAPLKCTPYWSAFFCVYLNVNISALWESIRNITFT